MSTNSEEHVATLILPDEYMRHLNQVASLSTKGIVVLKRKFVSKSGWELVSYPLSDCARIFHKDERPLTVVAPGLLLTALIAGIFYLLFVYWSDLEPSTRIPIGALGIAGFYGFRWVLGARRHKIIFELKDKTRLVWKSRPGDYKYKTASVQNVVEFAKSSGLWRPAQ